MPRFDLLIREVRQAARALRTQPGFVALVVLTLGIGIGATTTIFSVVDAVLLRPLPFREPERLVLIFVRPPQREFGGSPVAELAIEWKERARLFEGLESAAMGVSRYTMSGAGGAVTVRRQWVGQGLFDMLGVEPLIGRSFLPEDMHEYSSETAVLSYEFWRRQFAGDPAALGQSVNLLARPRVIIGVMPPGFRTNPASPDVDVWMARDYTGSSLRVPMAGRLLAEVTPEQAAAELQSIMDGLRPEVAAEERAIVELMPMEEWALGFYRSNLYLLLGAVSFVLLICCANVAGMLLVRGSARAREVATRLVLGASRARIVRELLAESVLLAVLGGIAGVLLAVWGIRLFAAIAPNFYPATDTFVLNRAVLAFALGVSLLVGIVTGLVPALRASGADLMSVVKGDRPARSGRLRTGSSLVVFEVALALVLLIGAGLMANSLVRVLNVDMGFETTNLLKAGIRVQGAAYQTTESPLLRISPQVAQFYDRVLSRLRAQPGVESVGLISGLAGASGAPVQAYGRPLAEGKRPTMIAYQEVNAGLFRTLGMAIVRGRDFTPQDDETASPVAILNETLARELFPDSNPIGQMIQADLTNRVRHPDLVGDPPREVIGIVSDIRLGLRGEAVPAVYVPFRQHLAVYPDSGPWSVHIVKDIVIRTSSEPGSMVRALNEAIADVDDTQVAYDVMTVEDQLSARAGRERLWMRLLGLCSAMALFLATLGIYGVISQTVARRTREVGVRMALGAQRGAILRLILRQGMVLILSGVAIGIGAAVGLTRLISNRLYGVTPTDPATFAAVSLLLIVVATLACYVPALRATRVHPLVALRHD